jgi:hypothetical protein
LTAEFAEEIAEFAEETEENKFAIAKDDGLHPADIRGGCPHIDS